MAYLKICLWSVSYTPVMLRSQWHHWSPSLHKGYPWYKVPSHTISRSWDTSGGEGGGWRGGMYIPLPPYFPYPLYAHYSSKKVYVQIKYSLFRSCLPSYVVVLPCSFTEGNISYYMFCILIFSSKFWNTKMDISRIYLTGSPKWL